MMKNLWFPLSMTLAFLLFGCTTVHQYTKTTQPLQAETIVPTRIPFAGMETPNTTKKPSPPYTPAPFDVTPTLTSQPEPFTHYAEIPPGLYIVYKGEKNHIFVTTPDKKFQALLTDKFDFCGNTSDGQQIYVCDEDKKYRLDIKLDRLDLIPADGEPSPDGEWVAHSCKGYEAWESLAVQQIGRNDEFCLVEQSSRGFNLAFLGWSPDGKWLAYTKRISKTFLHDPPDPEDGLYLVYTRCLSKPETCHSTTQGPFLLMVSS